MLKLDLNRLARVRGIHLSWGWFRRHHFSHWVAAKLMKGEVKSLRFVELEKLCNAFRCTPNALFAWTSPFNPKLLKDHHLKDLRRTQEAENIISLLTHEQLMEIAKAIKEEKEGGNKK